jgi:tetratricopeptide (TPR) repeat protein
MDHKKAIKIGFTCFTLCIMGLCLLEIAGTTPESDAWYNKGYSLSQQNKFDESIKAYDKAIEINPQLRSSAQ